MPLLKQPKKTLSQRLAPAQDWATFKLFSLIYGRQPTDEEYFSANTRIKLLLSPTRRG